MYPSLRSPAAAEGANLQLVGGPLRWLRVSRNVVLLGFTSMLTDISSEMVNAILPLYFVVELGFGPLAYGLFNAGYVALTALGRLASGVVGDRRGDHKNIAMLGYGTSAVCKLGILLATRSAALTWGALYIDRLGKGVRTTPRDALISLSSPPESLGEAFGVHRALDTLGAVLGPVVAFAVLEVVAGGFSLIFAISLGFAIAGFAVLGITVRNPAATATGVEADVASDPATSSSTARRAPHSGRIRTALRQPEVILLCVVAGLLGCATIPDAFVYLAFQAHANISVGLFPLLYVGTSIVYLFVAVPAGRIGDRIGRHRVFIAGYASLFVVYILLLVPSPGTVDVLLALVCFGSYYAATDGVLMAIISPHLQRLNLGTGIAVVSSSATVAQALASAVFGALWVWLGQVAAIRVYGVVLLAGLALAMTLLPRMLPKATQ